MSEIADAITGTVADMFGAGAVDGPTEDTAPAVAAEPAEVTDQQPEPEEAWSFEQAGRDLFTDDPEEAPDFDALAEAELGGQEQDEDVLNPSEYDDDQTRQLKKQLLAEKKRAEFHQRQHLTAARRAWEADVKEQPWSAFLPKDLSTIKASSHRDFLRQARQIARTNYEVLKPHYQALEAQKAKLKETVVQEARQQAAQAWGAPTVGGANQVPAEAEQSRRSVDDAIRRRSMVDVVKAMIETNQI